MKKYFFILLGITLAFSGCEKDDVCDANTVTTPKMVVSLYDNFIFENSGIDNEKKITQLRAKAISVSDNITWSGFTYLLNVSNFTLPLNTNTSTTEIQLMKYDESTYNVNSTPSSISTITINYIGKDIFVSRACGYKKNFELTGTPVYDNTNWIKNIIVSEYNIENEKVTHLKIYF